MVVPLVRKNHQIAFTLIELLVVITIIGILSAIVINIINPEEKQNMAHDGVIKSIMNKVVLSTEAFIAAYNRVPDENEFIHAMEITVIELFDTECSFVFSPDYECLFRVDGAELPHSCDLSFWQGSSLENQPCSFRYVGQIQGDPGRFRLYVKSMGMVSTLFAYDNLEGGKIYECPFSVADFDSLADLCQ